VNVLPRKRTTAASAGAMPRVVLVFTLDKTEDETTLAK
jgi:hypothetical protein